MIGVPRDDSLRLAPSWTRDGAHIALRCPRGHTSIVPDHAVRADGELSHGAACSKCSWRDFATLTDYAEDSS